MMTQTCTILLIHITQVGWRPLGAMSIFRLAMLGRTLASLLPLWAHVFSLHNEEAAFPPFFLIACLTKGLISSLGYEN